MLWKEVPSLLLHSPYQTKEFSRLVDIPIKEETAPTAEFLFDDILRIQDDISELGIVIKIKVKLLLYKVEKLDADIQNSFVSQYSGVLKISIQLPLTTLSKYCGYLSNRLFHSLYVT